MTVWSWLVEQIMNVSRAGTKHNVTFYCLPAVLLKYWRFVTTYVLYNEKGWGYRQFARNSHKSHIMSKWSAVRKISKTGYWPIWSSWNDPSKHFVSCAIENQHQRLISVVNYYMEHLHLSFSCCLCNFVSVIVFQLHCNSHSVFEHLNGYVLILNSLLLSNGSTYSTKCKMHFEMSLKSLISP